MLVEDSPQRVELKQQGGKLEAIPRSHIAEIDTSKLSLMPEDLDKTLKPQELVDLLTFLVLDRSPEDPDAKWLAGFDGPALRDRKTQTIDSVRQVEPARNVANPGGMELPQH